jgi:hypothetical protein
MYAPCMTATNCRGTSGLLHPTLGLGSMTCASWLLHTAWQPSHLGRMAGMCSHQKIVCEIGRLISHCECNASVDNKVVCIPEAVWSSNPPRATPGAQCWTEKHWNPRAQVSTACRRSVFCIDITLAPHSPTHPGTSVSAMRPGSLTSSEPQLEPSLDVSSHPCAMHLRP